MRTRLIPILMGLVFLGACASVRIPQEGGKSYRYFGFVEVIVPEKEPKNEIEAYRIQSAGLALEGGVSLGWRAREEVLVPLKAPGEEGTPYEATCSMVVIVRSDAEARHAKEILSDLKGENICLTSFQGNE